MKQMSNVSPFTSRVKQAIKNIPAGKVATYGQIASIAGSYRAARQVVRILHSSSRKDNLPWFRVINKKGQISLLPGNGFEQQKQLLEQEGIIFDDYNQIDLEQYLWQPPHGGTLL